MPVGGGMDDDGAGVGSSGGGADPSTSDTSVSHSREKISLCCEIILDHFGPVAAQVASMLLQRGRLTLRELSRFLATATIHAPTGYVHDVDDAVAQAEAGQTTNTPGFASGSGGGGGAPSSQSATTWSSPLRSQRLIQQTLITLIQHNLCWHARMLADGTLIQAPKDDSTALEDAYRGVEYFQINVEEVLARLRFGTYLSLAEETFGDVGSAVINEIMQHGKLRVSDIFVRTTKMGYREENVEDVVRDMLLYAYLQPSSCKSHSSPRDRRIGYESEEVMKMRKHLTPKDKLQIAFKARQRLADDDHEVWFSSKKEDIPTRRGLIRATKGKKRLAINGKLTNGKNAVGGASKKLKQTDGRSSIRSKQSTAAGNGLYDVDDDEDNPELMGADSFVADPQLFVRVNYDRLDVHIRNEMVVQAVRSRYNSPLASLMDAMLQINKGGYNVIPKTREVRSQVILTNNLITKLPVGLSMRKTFDREAIRQHLGSEKASSETALLGEALSVLLTEGEDKRFLSPADAENQRAGLGGYSKVQINFRNAARSVRRRILRNVVETQFGTLGARVMALLDDLGKLDEKHISKVCLMSMSETRDVCARLFAAGLLSLQEVPKASERTPGRSFFFWYVDERKCSAWLSDRLCKTLTRLAQRRRHEMAREADLMAKANRVDVRSDEGLLRDVERHRLQRIRQTVETFTLAEMRTWKDLFVVANLPE